MPTIEKPRLKERRRLLSTPDGQWAWVELEAVDRQRDGWGTYIAIVPPASSHGVIEKDAFARRQARLSEYTHGRGHP